MDPATGAVATDESRAYDIIQFRDREEWLAGRRMLGIGSSDAAAILGVSRFKSPLALYHEKLGVVPPRPESEERRAWGHILEEPIAQRYASTTKRRIVAPPEHSVARSRRYPFAIASVDRFVASVDTEVPGWTAPDGFAIHPAPGPGVVEVKNADIFMAEQWGRDNNNEPPVEYQVQLQHQLMVTGLQWGSIAALLGGNVFVWADIKRDNILIARLVELETEFMRRLERREEPAADGSESSREILKYIYPRDTGVQIQLPPDALNWHEELEAAKAAKKKAEADVDLYANLLKQAIGEATTGHLPNGYAYSFKAQSRAAFVSPATEFRVLRVHEPKKPGKKR